MPTRSSQRKRIKKNNSLEDRISELPDVIIVNILSLLEISEVVRTSVLSHKWREFWKWTTCLNFDASKVSLTQVSDCYGKPKAQRRARSRYMSWVNQVLQSHKSPSLNQFRVVFDLDASASQDIDGWIKFVIPKRVKILDIDLTSYTSDKTYALSQECYLCFKSALNLSSIKCVTSLSLKGVSVNGELLEYFLSNCEHLERLCISDSTHLVNLKVAGPSLQLKYLEICHCYPLENLELCSPNLVTLNYFGGRTNFHIGENPRLAELIIGGGYDQQVTYALVPFSSHLPQLETLKLTMFLKDNREIPQVPTLKNLKNLIVDVSVSYDESLLGLTNLIVAAQSLRKFTLQLESRDPAFHKRAREQMVVHPPPQSLKDVEILGFVGGRSDFELAKYLLKSSINLEKIVIDPYIDIYQPASTEASHLEEQVREIRTRALQLKEFLPPRAELSVL